MAARSLAPTKIERTEKCPVQRGSVKGTGPNERVERISTSWSSSPRATSASMSGVGVEHLPCRYTRLPDLTTCTAVFASHHVVMLHLILDDELEQVLDSTRSARCCFSLCFSSLPLRDVRSTKAMHLRR